MENCSCAPSSCGCQEKLPGVSPEAGLHLAIATIPIQYWETPYDEATALLQGTVFPCLDLPFFEVADGTKGGGNLAGQK